MRQLRATAPRKEHGPGHTELCGILLWKTVVKKTRKNSGEQLKSSTYGTGLGRSYYLHQWKVFDKDSIATRPVILG